MNLLDGLTGGIRAIYAGGVLQTFKTIVDFADMTATLASDRISLAVSALQGVPVSADAPSDGDLLTYDEVTESWVPAPGGLVDAAPADSLLLTYQTDAECTASKVLTAGTGFVLTPAASTVTISHDPEALDRSTATWMDLADALATQGVITLTNEWPA